MENTRTPEKFPLPTGFPSPKDFWFAAFPPGKRFEGISKEENEGDGIGMFIHRLVWNFLGLLRLIPEELLGMLRVPAVGYKRFGNELFGKKMATAWKDLGMFAWRREIPGKFWSYFQNLKGLQES